jgi:hypothetical protein
MLPKRRKSREREKSWSANVLSALHLVKVDSVRRLIGKFSGSSAIGAECGHAEHASSIGDDARTILFRAGMEEHHIDNLFSFFQSTNWLSLFVGARITA